MAEDEHNGFFVQPSRRSGGAAGRAASAPHCGGRESQGEWHGADESSGSHPRRVLHAQDLPPRGTVRVQAGRCPGLAPAPVAAQCCDLAAGEGFPPQSHRERPHHGGPGSGYTSPPFTAGQLLAARASGSRCFSAVAQSIPPLRPCRGPSNSCPITGLPTEMSRPTMSSRLISDRSPRTRPTGSWTNSGCKPAISQR